MKTTIKNSILAFGFIFSSICMANGYVGYDASVVHFTSNYASSKYNLVNQLSAGYLKKHNSQTQYGFEIAYHTIGKSTVNGTLYKTNPQGKPYYDHYVESFSYQASAALGVMNLQLAQKLYSVFKGGAQLSYAKAKLVVNDSTTQIQSATDISPVLGVGIEYKLLPQFSLTANYYTVLVGPSSKTLGGSYSSLGLRYHWT